MVFCPYRLFCSLLLKHAGIHTLHAGFLCNQTATAEIHDFLYSICGAKYEGFPSVQVYPKSCYTPRKTKAAGLPPYRLMFIFSQHRRHGCHRVFSLLESVRHALPIQIILTMQVYPENCCIQRKAMRQRIHAYRLMFIFSQHK